MFCKETFFGADVLGPPVWEPGRDFQNGHDGAPKTDLPAIILETPIEML
jgi:hypothetical protein